jgi:hsp70-interacting protein
MASGDPFAWLGLLKWSLSYSDGTTDAAVQPMSDEDREFLERVMKEGIVDENERMKTILKQVTSIMDKWKNGSATESEQHEEEGESAATDEEKMTTLLEELRDIVEQIDYARAFCALKGLPFLLGCVQERQLVPRSTRVQCLGVLATLAQHNPPVQQQLLDMGALKTLSDLYFVEDQSPVDDASGEVRARIIQAVSATVRGFDVAEQVFGELEQSAALVQAGLGVGESPDAPPSADVPTIVRKRTLFFLRAVLTSDYSTRRLVQRFAGAIAWVANHFVIRRDVQDSIELVEMGLSLLVQLLEQRRCVDPVLQLKEALVGAGVERVNTLRQLQGDERDDAAHQLELWEQLLVLLARSAPDESLLPQ